jgi:pSer/pThr/pTyr-binding forkhead associated (FHA) protein
MDVFLLDPRVSRRHALLRVESDGVAVLVDLGSASGTYVNGRRLHGSVELRHGDRIRLGGSVMEFVEEASSIYSIEEFSPFSRNT